MADKKTDPPAVELTSVDAYAPYDVHFGARLLRARTAAGLTQTKLGEAVGVSASYISRLESGHKEPPPDVQHALERALGAAPGGLGSQVVLGRHTVVEGDVRFAGRAVVDHHAVLRARTGGRIEVGNEAVIGVGAHVFAQDGQTTRIDDGAVVGPGAVVESGTILRGGTRPNDVVSRYEYFKD